MTGTAIYCRISQDTEGKALGVARQEADCRDLAERLGLPGVVVFVDNDRGASTRSRKTRPAFTEMVTRAETGEFGAIVAYSTSRLTRRPLEFDQLITLAERRHVRILTVVSGQVSLDTADGRAVARTLAAWDAAEAERTAERVARKHLENAMNGKAVGGTRPFGYEADKVTVRPVEADLIRQAAADVIAGVPVRAVARLWAEAGVVSPRGLPWSHRTLRQMLKGPRLAGLRVHRGQLLTGADGEPVRGQWEPILDLDTHRRVVAALTTPDTRSRRPRRGARHYLLTGVVRCGVCNAPMYGNRYAEGRHYYVCKPSAGSAHPHTNTVSGVGVDGAVEALVLRYLDRQGDLPTAEPAPFAGAARLDAVNAQISELMAAFVAGTLSGAVVFPAVERLEAERDALEADRAVHDAPTGPDLSRIDRETWAGWDTDRRRAAVEALLDAVLIRPATRRQNRLDLDRIEVVWKEQRR